MGIFAMIELQPLFKAWVTIDIGILRRNLMFSSLTHASFFPLDTASNAVTRWTEGRNGACWCEISNVSRLWESDIYHESNKANQGNGDIVDVAPWVRFDNEPVDDGTTCNTEIQGGII